MKWLFLLRLYFFKTLLSQVDQPKQLGTSWRRKARPKKDKYVRRWAFVMESASKLANPASSCVRAGLGPINLWVYGKMAYGGLLVE